MNGRAQVVAQIRETGVVPVVRAPSADAALACAAALRAGGLRIVEITMTVPDAPRVIRRLAQAHADLLIGAGSVLDAETARACVAAGARFIVSPVLNPEVIACGRVHDAAGVPGALTPTEIVHAWNAGADLVKVFPVHALGGASYIRSVLAALPHLLLVPTGGVSLASAASYIEAGAAAIGVGSELADVNAITRGTPERIGAAARAFVDAVQAARDAPPRAIRA